MVFGTFRPGFMGFSGADPLSTSGPGGGATASRPEPHAPALLVVMPAYNAARTLHDTWVRLAAQGIGEILLVDDGSTDGTAALAERMGLRVIRHPHNVGYGGNQKTCYMEALRTDARAVVMLHPDGQYLPEQLADVVGPIMRDEADVVLGSRMLVKGAAKRGGMPAYKRVANRVLTWIENTVMRTHVSELHTGYRAFSRRFLEGVPFLRNSNDFVFDQEMMAQAVAFGFRIAEVPVECRYFEEASSATFWQSVVYGVKTVRTMWTFALHRSGLRRSRLFVR